MDFGIASFFLHKIFTNNPSYLKSGKCVIFYTRDRIFKESINIILDNSFEK